MMEITATDLKFLSANKITMPGVDRRLIAAKVREQYKYGPTIQVIPIQHPPVSFETYQKDMAAKDETIRRYQTTINVSRGFTFQQQCKWFVFGATSIGSIIGGLWLVLKFL